MSTKKEKDQAKMIELSCKPFDDIYEGCLKIAKDWGNENLFSVVVIEETVNIVIKNTKKIKDKDLREYKTNYILTLNNLINFCKIRANEMGSKSIPKTEFKEIIEAVKDAIRKGGQKNETIS